MKEKGLARAIATVARLRKDCPWDKKQTHESLRAYLLEEAHETLEAIDRKNPQELKEELGDLLLQILLHAEIAAEQGDFTLDELAENLAEKLVRRHPHVFAKSSVSDLSKQWEKIKAEEKNRDSRLDGIPVALPALQKSLKVIEKVSQLGFQWENLAGPWEKVQEELAEFLAEIQKLGELPLITRKSTEEIPAENRSRLEAELGDLLFTLANISYFLRLNPEDALRSMLGRFTKRFQYVEARAKERGVALELLSLVEMDEYWNEAKERL